MGNTVRNHSSHALRRSLAHGGLVLGIAGVSVLLAVPAVAQAASSIHGRQTNAVHITARASSICDKVSAASVSALIGYKVPAGTGTTFNIKPTKANYEISGTNTICTYGSAKSMAAVLKDVSLSIEVISKPLTSAEMQQSIEKASKTAKIKFTTYSGLGVPGFYFSVTEEGITGQGITGIENGTHFFSADVENKNVSKSTIAALAKLAEKL
ncbi:MAG: hypothetical protein ABSE75_12390 [Acidimicrobiales bacterium]|jgi:hypothetical protein